MENYLLLAHLDCLENMSSFKNIYISQAATIISFVISALLLFISTYFLSVDDRGIFGLIYSLPALLITFTDFGIAPVLIRYSSMNKNLDKLLTSIFLLHLIRIIVTVLISVFIIFFFGEELFKVSNIYLFLGVPIILSLSVNSFLSPYFYGINKVIIYYFFIIIPNLILCVFSILLLIFDYYNLLNISIIAAMIYSIHFMIVTYFYSRSFNIRNFKFYKIFFKLLDEAKFLFASNIFNYGFMYLIPIVLNYNFGITTLSYILFSIALADKLLLVGDSVGYEIIRKLNVFKDDSTLNNKLKYFKSVVFYMIPIIIISSMLIYFVTKYFFLVYVFEKYLPILDFFYLIMISFAIQALIRIYQQYYNGLGDTKFTMNILVISSILKTLCLIFVTSKVTTLFLLFILIDFILLTFIISKTHFKKC